jgi:hypothetical protein
MTDLNCQAIISRSVPPAQRSESRALAAHYPQRAHRTTARRLEALGRRADNRQILAYHIRHEPDTIVLS